MESRREASFRLKAICILTVEIIVVGGLGAQFVKNLPPPEYFLVPGSADVLPSFQAKPVASVVQVPDETSQGVKMALVSLQGLVNRQGAQIFLETGGDGNTSFLLPFIDAKYPVNFRRISSGQFLANFSSFASGLVVYDPARPDTINVATVIAGLDDYLIVDPSAKDDISRMTHLEVKIDLREAPWAGLSAIQLYRKSFDELYPRTSRDMLAILEPEKLWLRDYLVAAKAWAFYVRQGPFTSKANLDFTEEILSSTPHGIPILGWFETPNIVEENFFVQVASRHGKSILGGHNVPNISFLSGLAPPEPFHQKRVLPPPPTLDDNGIYVTFAVPDGDNLDFAASKLLDVWNDPIRGTVPVAWSISPLLAELAPPLLDYYYSNASVFDSFVAGPSGAGYLYPGYLQSRDLEQHLIRTRDAMETADLDIVWLLNSFKAYEIPYSEETLDAYVDALEPRGLILDYADQAVTRDVWMQGGEDAAAPVIRSTHLWSGLDNLLGKAMVDIDASSSGPSFFLITVYPWSLRIGDAVKALDLLKCRYGDRVSAVSIETLMALLGKSFITAAGTAVDLARANAFAILDPWDIESANALLEQTRRDELANDSSLACFHAYAALEHARRAIAVGTIFLLVLLSAIVFGATFFFSRRRKRSEPDRQPAKLGRLPPAIASALLFYLFLGGLDRALEYNFWTYASVFVAGLAVMFSPILQKWLQDAQGRNSWLTEVFLLAASGLFLLFEPWAFVPYACATAMLLFRFLRHGGMGRNQDALLLGVGLAGSAIFSFNVLSLVLSALILVGLAYLMKPQIPVNRTKKPNVKTTGVSFAATVLALQAVWLMLPQNRYFSEKADGGLDMLLGLAVLAFVAAPAIALALWRLVGPRRKFDALTVLTVSTILWIALWLSRDTVILAVLILSIATMVAWSHLSASSRVEWTDAALCKFVSSLLILCTIVIVLIRVPAIVYSLYVAKFPLPVEYILYTPALLMIFATLDIVQTEALVRFARKPGRKNVETNP